MLQHVSLEVPQDQVARTIEFWGLLGFEHTEAPEPIAPYVTWLQREGTQIHLIHTDEATVPPLGHAAVVAADFEGAVARLRGADFEVEDARKLVRTPLEGDRPAVGRDVEREPGAFVGLEGLCATEHGRRFCSYGHDFYRDPVVAPITDEGTRPTRRAGIPI